MIGATNAASLLYGRMDSGAGLSPVLTAGKTAAAMNDEQLNKVSADFESLFVSQMLEQMFGDSLGEEAFGDRETSEVYKGLMVEEYGRQIASAGGVGIAAYIKKELLKLQEITHG